jgi:hypothetical protein
LDSHLPPENGEDDDGSGDDDWAGLRQAATDVVEDELQWRHVTLFGAGDQHGFKSPEFCKRYGPLIATGCSFFYSLVCSTETRRRSGRDDNAGELSARWSTFEEEEEPDARALAKSKGACFHNDESTPTRQHS